MKRGILLAGALIGTVILLALALSRLNSAMEPAMNHVVTQRTGPLVLDAGHGGEDGGAVSITAFQRAGSTCQSSLAFGTCWGSTA